MTNQSYSLMRSLLFMCGAAAITLIACDLFSPGDDGDAPVITIIGPETDTLGIYHTYIDSGATATDAQDGDLSSAIQVTDNIDTTQTGTYSIVYKVTDSDGNTTTATRVVVVVDNTIGITASSCPAVYDCTSVTYTISGNLTIPSGCNVTFGPHTRIEILERLTVNGELIIREGAHILLDEASTIVVDQGTITAQGKDTANILFTNYSSGKYWGQGQDDSYWYSRYALRLSANANANSSLSYCVFDSATTGILVEKDAIAITNCTFTNCAYAGIYFDDCGPKDSSSFMNNQFISNGKTARFFPLYLDATYLSRLSGSATFTDNTVDAVAVTGDDVTTSGSWKKLAVPYVFQNDVSIDNASGVTITVHPGTAFEFNEDVTITVDNATFIAEGSADDSIVFSSFEHGKYWGQGKDDSYWYSRYGLRFTDNANTNSSLSYCVFDSATTGIYMEKDGISISHCTFTNCAYAGIYFDDCGPKDSTAFIHNAFVSNGKTARFFPLYIDATYLARLSGTAVFTNNTIDAVAVTGEQVTESGTWKKLPVPYVFNHDATINNTNGIQITIEPGTAIRLLEDVTLSIDHGTLVAQGTATDSITFSNFEHGKYWGQGQDDSYWYSRYGLRFTDNANTNSSLSYCTFDSATTGILFEKDGITISHCTFTNCAYAGIYFDDCGPKDSTAFIHNAFVSNGKTSTFFPLYIKATYLSRLSGTSSFTGNAIDAVAVEGDEVTESGSWKRLVVPYVFTEEATIDNTNGVEITIHPGTRFEFQDDAYLAVNHGTLIANGTVTDSIWFSTYENGVFWGHGEADSYNYSLYGLRFTDNANANCSVSYCVIDSATTGINSDECLVNISHSTIKNCMIYGIYSYGTGNTNIDYASITFSNNGTGPYLHED